MIYCLKMKNFCFKFKSNLFLFLLFLLLFEKMFEGEKMIRREKQDENVFRIF